MLSLVASEDILSSVTLTSSLGKGSCSCSLGPVDFKRIHIKFKLPGRFLSNIAHHINHIQTIKTKELITKTNKSQTLSYIPSSTSTNRIKIIRHFLPSSSITTKSKSTERITYIHTFAESYIQLINIKNLN